MVNVENVAKNIVNYSISIKSPISNLKLQKLLYFSWIEYYKKTQRYLFKEEFYAWQFGPVVPQIYKEYCVYGGLPIAQVDDNLQNDIIDSEIFNTIKEVVDEYKNYSALDLVNLTHKQGHAWDRVYRNGYGNRRCISFEDIINYECY